MFSIYLDTTIFKSLTILINHRLVLAGMPIRLMLLKIMLNLQKSGMELHLWLESSFILRSLSLASLLYYLLLLLLPVVVLPLLITASQYLESDTPNKTKTLLLTSHQLKSCH